MIEIKHRIDLVSLLPENSVVAEVGVATGRFSEQLLEAGVGELWMIDVWATIPGAFGDGAKTDEWHSNNLNEAVERVMRFNPKFKISKGLSSEWAKRIPDNSLDMVYLDGDHTYEGCKADLHSYYPKIKTGGIIAGHDYLNIIDYGVNKAVNEFCDGKFDVIVIPEDEPNNASFYFIKP